MSDGVDTAAGVPAASGAFIAGGIGALLMLGGAALITLPLFQGSVGDTEPAMGGHLLIAVGLVMVGWALLAARPLTNSLARIAALDAFIAAFAELVLGLGFAGLVELGTFFGVLLFLFPVFFVMLGIWGFSAIKQLGFLGGAIGGTALLGGLMVIAYHAMNLAGSFRRIDDDLALMLIFGGLGMCGIACLAIISLTLGGHLNALPVREA